MEDNINNQIINLGNQVKTGKLKWREVAEMVNKQFGTNFNSDNIRCRYKYYVSPEDMPRKEEGTITNNELTTYNADGSIDICKELWFDENEIKSPETILKKFGYDANEWDIVSWSFGKWEVAIKDETENRVCTTIRARIKPKIKNDISLSETLEIAKETLQSNIKPLEFKKTEKIEGLDKNKMLEMTGIELHLGKMAWSGDTGQDYDKNIAQERFYKIYQEVCEQQEIEKCDTCLLCIGNDFFNSDTVNATTTKGTPQTNDLRWKKMFNLGLEMYSKMILGLSERFNKIEVRLQSGNHDKMASFYLYIALSCFFKNNKNILFINDYKDVQCFEWGNCAIFFNHGDSNLKRTIKSIPAEFYEIWGRTIFRELHLGHLHKEVVVDDESGLITRRIGSPTGTDQWHYEERFVGSTQKYQTFVWDKNKGLLNIKYINFDNKKKLIRKRKKKNED